MSDGTISAGLPAGPASGAGWLRARPAITGIFLVSIALALASCSGGRSAFEGKGSPIYSKSGPIPQGGGRRKIGNPYQIAGKWYRPEADPDYDKSGTASWYGPKFHRRMTANGEWFDMDRISAAHPTLPLPSYVRVTNRNNGKSLVVRLNDRGPYASNRIIDLSRKSARLLGFERAGTGPVRVTYLGPAPLDRDDPRIAAQENGPVQFADLEPGRSKSAPVRVASARPRDTAVQTRNSAQQQTALYDPRTQTDTRKTSARQEIGPAGFVEPAIASNGADDSAEPVEGSVYARVEPPSSPSQSGVYIQAAAYADPRNAEVARRRLAAIGDVSVAPKQVGQTIYHRVQLGPFTNETSARGAIDRLADAGFSDARISLR